MTLFTYYNTENSDGERLETLQRIEKKYGFIPNLFAYMAEAPYIIDAYVMLGETLERSSLTSEQIHIALLAISTYNQCEFCQVAHQAFAKVSGANPDTIDAIINGKTINDHLDRALVDMALEIVDQRGWVDDDQVNAFIDAGFNRANIFDLILMASLKTLSNYANHFTKPHPNKEILAMLK